MKRLLTCVAALVATLALASPAAAELGLEPGSFSVRMHDAAGADVTQAGAHPDLTVEFMLRAGENAAGRRVVDGSLKDVAIELPRGIVGNPRATPRCTHGDFTARQCDRAALVGVEELRTAATPGQAVLPTLVPVYNLVPPDGVVARFGFAVASAYVAIDMRVRSDGDYNLVADIGDLSELLMVYGSKLTLWGVPADMNGPGPLAFNDLTNDGTFGAPSGEERVPFLSAPAECGPQQAATISATSWQQPDRVVRETVALPAITGCEQLSLESSLALSPERPRAGVPSAVVVDMPVAQPADPDGLAAPTVRDVDVTLPEGVAVSPSSAQGLVGCTNAQAAFGSLEEPACPAASKIGTVSIDTPLLDGPLTGGVFLGEPRSMDAQTGEMLRIFLVAAGYGVTVKIEGKITPDPVTGRLRAVFRDLPQLPFSLLRLRFQGGERAPLTTPRVCGTHTTRTEIVAWSGQRVSSDSAFEITQDARGNPCAPLGFAPSFAAGMGNATAGAFAPLTVTFGRDDAQQDLGDLTVRLPPGVTGMLASADLCAEAQAAAGTCGEGSRIGSATVTAGAGADPYQLPGRVYVGGPYKGAPFGLSIVVPARAGPFDLGTVVVRAAIHVDRTTAALTVVSDPMPTILQGIPLRVRTVSIAIDRPGFMVNPTSCTQKRVEGTVRSATGASAQVGSRLQVGGCRDLGFRPRLGLRVGGRGRTRAGITTPLTARLATRPGDANLRGVTVKLPRTINARLPVINDACTLEQFRTGTCTKQVGTATAVTPILREPLSGPAYFVRNPARRIPDLMVALRGQVEIDLVGKVTVPRDLTLKTRFDTIPDVPITSFALRLVAGRGGPLSTIPNLCTAQARRQSVAMIGYRGQNGRLIRAWPRLGVDGCAKRKPKPQAESGR